MANNNERTQANTMPKTTARGQRAPKGVLRRLLKMLFEFYPVLLPVAIVCILINAIVSTIPSIFMQNVTDIVDNSFRSGDWAGVSGKILGLEEDHDMIIIGAGNLGHALANYAAFEKRGFVLKGIFDVNPTLKGMTIRGVPIHMMDELEDFVKNNDIEIGILTIPKAKAIEVANQLVSYGVKAIWNFAHTDLNLPDDVIVENVHLSESLMRLSYNISRYNEEQKKSEK